MVNIDVLWTNVESPQIESVDSLIDLNRPNKLCRIKSIYLVNSSVLNYDRRSFFYVRVRGRE